MIKKYFCEKCRNANPGLKIKYKRKYREQFMLTQPPPPSSESSNSSVIKKPSPVDSSLIRKSPIESSNTSAKKPSPTESTTTSNYLRKDMKSSLTASGHSHTSSSHLPPKPKQQGTQNSKERESVIKSEPSSSREPTTRDKEIGTKSEKFSKISTKESSSKHEKNGTDGLLSFAPTKFSSSDKSEKRKDVLGSERSNLKGTGSSSMLASILGSTSKSEETRKEHEVSKEHSVSKDEKKSCERSEKSLTLKERKIRPEDAILKDKPFKLGKSSAEKNLERLLQAEMLKTSEKMKDDKSKHSAIKIEPDKANSTAIGSMPFNKDIKKTSEVGKFEGKDEQSRKEMSLVEMQTKEKVATGKEKVQPVQKTIVDNDGDKILSSDIDVKIDNSKSNSGGSWANIADEIPSILLPESQPVLKKEPDTIGEEKSDPIGDDNQESSR